MSIWAHASLAVESRNRKPLPPMTSEPSSTDHPEGSNSGAPAAASLTRPVVATVLLLVMAGLCLRLWLCWQPLASMLGGYVADDAFYYLNIARNLAAGLGPTFDGSTPTNGFHPLYMGLLWLLTGAGITEPVLLLRVALSLLAVASAATGLVLFAVARRALGVTAGVVALLMWELGPQPIRISLTGVEVALSVLLCATTALAWMRTREGLPSSRSNRIRCGRGSRSDTRGRRGGPRGTASRSSRRR